MAVSLPKGWFDEVRRRAAVDAVEADHLLRRARDPEFAARMDAVAAELSAVFVDAD